MVESKNAFSFFLFSFSIFIPSFLPLQAKMAFPFWNWVSSRKSSWTFPLPIRESRHTRPVSTSPTRDRSASSAESRRPINCSATRSTPPWSRARWATLSNTGKWTLLESLPKKPKKLESLLPSRSTDLDTSNCGSIPATSRIPKPVWLSSSLQTRRLKNSNPKATFPSTPTWSNEPKSQSNGMATTTKQSLGSS